MAEKEINEKQEEEEQNAKSHQDVERKRNDEFASAAQAQVERLRAEQRRYGSQMGERSNHLQIVDDKQEEEAELETKSNQYVERQKRDDMAAAVQEHVSHLHAQKQRCESEMDEIRMDADKKRKMAKARAVAIEHRWRNGRSVEPSPASKEKILGQYSDAIITYSDLKDEDLMRGHVKSSSRILQEQCNRTMCQW